MPRSLVAALILGIVAGGALRLANLEKRGLWEVDEATYCLAGRAYVYLFEAFAEARRQGVGPTQREEMRRVIERVFPMDYDFQYHFTRGPARPDVLMSGFRTWGKPAHVASVALSLRAVRPGRTWATLIPSALFGAALVGAVGWAAWRLTFDAWNAAGATAWAAVSFALVHYSRSGYAVMLWTLAFTLALGVAFGGWRKDPTREQVAGGTFLRGLLIGIMLSAFYGLLPLVGLLAGAEVWWLWRYRATSGAAVRSMAIWVGAMLLPLLLWQAFGVWRAAYLQETLGFPQVFSYFGEIWDQLKAEVELPRHGLGTTVRFWAGNLVAMEGLPACLVAVVGFVALTHGRDTRPHCWSVLLAIAVLWLVLCTVSRLHLGRIYTPLVPIFGLCVGGGVGRLSRQSRVAAVCAILAILAYGLWNLHPLLALRSGIPRAAEWLKTEADPGRVAVATFGYNQLFRASLNREVVNPPTWMALREEADVYVEVGPIATRFTEAAVRAEPAALFQDPPLHFPPARIDLGVHLDPWWRFRLDRRDWARLRGRDPDPRLVDLIRVYRVDALP